MAHSQFDTFARPEIEDLKAAFLDLHINPELVYKVVQKRTRTRFASSRGEGRYEKVPVGLVVDREVTDKMKDPNYPNYQNYYMVSVDDEIMHGLGIAKLWIDVLLSRCRSLISA